MTMPLYPFTLVHPPSYVANEVPTPAELNQLQEQVAAAADGRVFTDVALFKNWTSTVQLAISSTNYGRAPVYDPKSRRWLVFGVNPSSYVSAAYTCSGARWRVLNAGYAEPGGFVGTSLSPRVAAASKAGLVVVGGLGTGGGSTALKLRRTYDGGNTWFQSTLGSSDVGEISSLVYSEVLGLWVAAQHVADIGIWTSPDAITWTKRDTKHMDNLMVRDKVGDPLFVGWGTASVGSSYFTSPDGITWTTRTAPVDTGADNHNGCYSAFYDMFFMPLVAGLYKSPTALTGSWTLVDATFGATFPASIGAFGRCLIRSDGMLSIDGGATWVEVFEGHDSAGADIGHTIVTAEGVGVMLATDASPGDMNISLLGSF